MRYPSIIVLLLTLTVTRAQTSVPDSTKQLLFEKESLLFAGVPDSVAVRIFTDKAFALRSCGAFELATRELERALVIVGNPASAEWKYEALMNYYLSGNFQKARDLLERFDQSDAERISRKKEYLFLRWGTFVELKEWIKCRDELLSFSIADDLQYLVEEIKTLPTEVRYKNPAKARRLSGFLPGAGSVYAGYSWKGITSFIVNAGWATGTIFLATQQLYITATVSGLLPLVKFYRGNISLSEQLAERKNLEKELALKELYYQKAKELIK